MSEILRDYEDEIACLREALATAERARDEAATFLSMEREERDSLKALLRDKEKGEVEHLWWLGAMNDTLFIINAPPRPSTDDVWHDRPDGPTVAIPVHGLPDRSAQMVVDHHNAALANVKARASAAEALLREAGEMLDEAQCCIDADEHVETFHRITTLLARIKEAT